jgi:hypothetical protein
MSGNGIDIAAIDESTAFDIQIVRQRLPVRYGSVQHFTPFALPD